MNRLEDDVSVQEIVHNCGMSARPEFYSGRGAILDDLDSLKLEGIYTAIERIHGKGAAENYVKMVAAIPRLTATDFLLSLYRLESHEWEWKNSLVGNERGNYATDEATGMATIFEVLTGRSKRDESDAIRIPFLEKHGIKIKRAKRSNTSPSLPD